MSENNLPIHVGKKRSSQGRWVYLFLRKKSDGRLAWFEHTAAGEAETSLSGSTVEEAMLFANREWKQAEFRPLMCGFRFSLPERDEIGTNALFSQMAASYSSMNGFYFDEDVGHHCIVHNASLEAQTLWRQLA